MHGENASIEELLDWRPYDYFTYRNTVPTPMGQVRFLVTTELEPTAEGTLVRQRLAAPDTLEERRVMEQMSPWMDDALRKSTSRLAELLEQERARLGGVGAESRTT